MANDINQTRCSPVPRPALPGGLSDVPVHMPTRDITGGILIALSRFAAWWDRLPPIGRKAIFIRRLLTRDETHGADGFEFLRELGIEWNSRNCAALAQVLGQDGWLELTTDEALRRYLRRAIRNEVRRNENPRREFLPHSAVPGLALSHHPSFEGRYALLDLMSRAIREARPSLSADEVRLLDRLLAGDSRAEALKAVNCKPTTHQTLQRKLSRRLHRFLKDVR